MINKKVTVYNDALSPAYKATALNAQQQIGLTKSLKEQSEYIYDKMNETHPEIAWGCDVILKRSTEKHDDITHMCSG